MLYNSNHFLLYIIEHYENTDYACGATQRDPALEAQDIISQEAELTSSAQRQGVLAGTTSPSDVTALLPHISSSTRQYLAQCRQIPRINLQPCIN